MQKKRRAIEQSSQSRERREKGRRMGSSDGKHLSALHFDFLVDFGDGVLPILMVVRKLRLKRQRAAYKLNKENDVNTNTIF